MSRPFAYRRGQLARGAKPLAALARRFGTPLFVYDLDAVLAAYGAYERAFARVPHQICAAVKANANRAVQAALARAGSGFDIVSGGELAQVLAAGGEPRRVVFSGVGKTAGEMDAALRAGIGLFNVESAPELALLAERARRLRRVAPFGLRVNPDVAAPTHRHIATGRRGHKFGVAPAEALALYRQYAGHRWVRATAASVHIGSQILDPAPFAAAVRRLGRFAAEVRAAGCALEALDIGGGLGIAYRPGERAPSPAAYARAVLAALGADAAAGDPNGRTWRRRESRRRHAGAARGEVRFDAVGGPTARPGAGSGAGNPRGIYFPGQSPPPGAQGPPRRSLRLPGGAGSPMRGRLDGPPRPTRHGQR